MITLVDQEPYDLMVLMDGLNNDVTGCLYPSLETKIPYMLTKPLR